jgi:hypothetical protein
MSYCDFCVFAYSDVQPFVLSHAFTFCVPCCNVRYDFRIKTMFDSSLPSVVCRRTHVNSVCLCIVSCVLTVACFSGLSIFDFLFF